MGEIMRTQRDTGTQKQRWQAYKAINSKRLDFLVIDPYGYPVLAVEYQGAGHYQGNAIERDAVKRAALEKASIPFIEVPAQYDQEEIEQHIRTILQASRTKRNRHN